MVALRVAALLWLPAVCLGGAPPGSRASLLQLGSLSKRGATMASGEARGFSSTLAGFQKYTDQLVDSYLKEGVLPRDLYVGVEVRAKSTAADNGVVLPGIVTATTVGTLATRAEEVAGVTTMCTVTYPSESDPFSVACDQIEPVSGNDMKSIIALIVNYINIDMFNALVLLHHADVELLSECDACTESDSENCGDTDSMHRCARQRSCGLVYWGKTANNDMKLWSNAWTASGTGYHDALGNDYGAGDGSGERDAADDTPSREQELWHLRDRTASLRKEHKTCVNTNKNIDQQNDLWCRRYNRYRGAKGPTTNDDRPDPTDLGTDVNAKLHRGPRNIYEDVGLSMTDNDLRNAFTTDTLCRTDRGHYNSKLPLDPQTPPSQSIFWSTCCDASWAATSTCNTLGQADEDSNGLLTCRADPCQVDPDTFEFNSYTPVIDGVAHATSLPVTSQTTEKKKASVYPTCATESGSLWKTVTSAEDVFYWRVDGRKHDNWLEGDLSKQMIMAEDQEARKVMEVCLEAVNVWFHPLYHYYIKCTHNDFHSDFETCKDEQNAYETQTCAWREQEDKFCDEYDKCIEDQCDECSQPDSQLCASVATKVAARKADYETGQRIICLLSVLIDAEGCSGDFCKDQQTEEYVDANGETKVRKIAGVDAAATTYANKTVRLTNCKNKATNENANVYRELTNNECITRKTTAFQDNYKLLTYSGSGISAVNSSGDSVASSSAGAIETTEVGITDGSDFQTLDSTLDNEANAENGSPNCVIDTEQWDLQCDKGQNPPPCPVAKYPYSFCVVQDKLLLDQTALTLTYGCGSGGAKVSVDRSHGSSDATGKVWKSALSMSHTDVPTYYVDIHDTTTDTYDVPCSADFFLNDYWGYVKSNDNNCVATSAPETCAQTTFEPTVSLDDAEKDQSAAGGVPLHWKMFPRPSIMQKADGVRPANAFNRVDCDAAADAGCKLIKVHADYFGVSGQSPASVWAPAADTTFHYDGQAGPSAATSLPYTAPRTSTTIESFATAFNIYGAAQPWQFSAYPDHFSYRWCVKCLSGNLNLHLESATWTWKVEGRTLQQNFAGNCEGFSLTEHPSHSNDPKPTGLEVKYKDTVNPPLEGLMPAYHPTSCASAVTSTGGGEKGR